MTRKLLLAACALLLCAVVRAQGGLDRKMQAAGLVDVLGADSTLRVRLMYSTADNFMGRDVYGDLETAYLLPHFAAKVVRAQNLLRRRKPGWRLLVCDAARPISVQRLMYSLVEGTPNQVYVANGARGGRHNYGVAVDVTLLDASGREADMGTSLLPVSLYRSWVNRHFNTQCGNIFCTFSSCIFVWKSPDTPALRSDHPGTLLESPVHWYLLPSVLSPGDRCDRA